MTNVGDLVAHVKDFALEHYEDGGWDVVIECWSDDEIAEQIGRARTTEGAVKAFASLINVWSDRQADAKNSAF